MKFVMLLWIFACLVLVTPAQKPSSRGPPMASNPPGYSPVPPVAGSGCPLDKSSLEPMLSFILPSMAVDDSDDTVLEEYIREEVLSVMFKFPDVYALPAADEIINRVTDDLINGTIYEALQTVIAMNPAPEELVKELTESILSGILELRTRCKTSVMRGLSLEALTNWTSEVAWGFINEVDASAEEGEIIQDVSFEIIKAIHLAFLTPELESLHAEGAALARTISYAMISNFTELNITQVLRPIQILSQCPSMNIFIEWSLFSIEKLQSHLIEVCPRRVLSRLLPRVLSPCMALDVMSGSRNPEIKDMVELLRDFVEVFQEWVAHAMDLYEDAIIKEEIGDLKEAIKPRLSEEHQQLLEALMLMWDMKC